MVRDVPIAESEGAPRAVIALENDYPAGHVVPSHRHRRSQLPCGASGAVPLALPFPAHRALARRCRQFLLKPTPHETIERWSEAMAMSRRAFTRLFRRETGLSFGAWRQRACLVAALPRLAGGELVTSVAIDLGYNNPAAFTTMFKRVLGPSPRHYFQQSR